MAVSGAENYLPIVSGITQILWKVSRRLIFKKYLAQLNWSIRSLIKGKKYLFLIIIELKPL